MKSVTETAIFRKSTECFQKSQADEFQGAKKPQWISQIIECLSLNLDQNINLSAGKEGETVRKEIQNTVRDS